MNTMMTMSTTPGSPGPASVAREILVFKVGEEEYAIDILRVQEIRGYEAPTRIAHTPAHILGVINLRGAIVPLVDMRIKFAIGQAQYNAFTVVIVLNLGGRIVGIVVDSVADVATLGPDQVRPAPELPSSPDALHITGLGVLGERMLIMLDIDRLIGGRDMGLFDNPARD